MHTTVLDFAVTAWIASLVVLLFVFLRYAIRIRLKHTLRESYWYLSAAIAMSVYDVGNLVLISWFWWKMHQGWHVANSGDETLLIFGGCVVSIMGLLCKIRVFSDSNKEAVGAFAIIFGLSAIAVITCHNVFL